MKTLQPSYGARSSKTSKNILYSLILFGMGVIVGGFAGVFIFIFIITTIFSTQCTKFPHLQNCIQFSERNFLFTVFL